jgi:hypothetical protein
VPLFPPEKLQSILILRPTPFASHLETRVAVTKVWDLESRLANQMLGERRKDGSLSHGNDGFGSLRNGVAAIPMARLRFAAIPTGPLGAICHVALNRRNRNGLVQRLSNG